MSKTKIVPPEERTTVPNILLVKFDEEKSNLIVAKKAPGAENAELVSVFEGAGARMLYTCLLGEAEVKIEVVKKGEN